MAMLQGTPRRVCYTYDTHNTRQKRLKTMKNLRITDTRPFGAVLIALAACFPVLFDLVTNAGFDHDTLIRFVAFVILATISLLFSLGVCHSNQQPE